MKILVVSDTHSQLDTLQMVLSRGKYDKIFHLGDSEGDELKISLMSGIPLEIVRGNCDIFSQLSDTIITSIAGNNIMLTHGHRYYVKSGHDELVRAARQNGAKYVFYGHTHKPFLQNIDGITVANPGSLSYPRGGGPSFMELEENAGALKITLKYLDEIISNE